MRPVHSAFRADHQPAFPTAPEWKHIYEQADKHIFPLPPIPRPGGSTACSRGRQRLRTRRTLRREANHYIATLNCLDKGATASMTECN